MLESGRFNAHKNTIVLMIVMLDCSEINIEISDTSMETIESDDCREMSRDDGDTNNILATIQEGARFFYKDGWKFINLFA